MTEQSVPVSCSLSEKGAVGQVREWSDLVDRAAAVEPLPDGARLWLSVDLAAAARDLAEREARCCGFLDIAVRATDADVVVDIRSADPDAWSAISTLIGVTPS